MHFVKIDNFKASLHIVFFHVSQLSRCLRMVRGGISFAIRKENRECTINLVNRGNTTCVHTLFNLSAGLSGALHDITFVFQKNYIAEVREKGVFACSLEYKSQNSSLGAFSVRATART